MDHGDHTNQETIVAQSLITFSTPVHAPVAPQIHPALSLGASTTRTAGRRSHAFVSHSVKVCLSRGLDIHDVSGSGSRKASLTLSQPPSRGMNPVVPLRVDHLKERDVSHA